MGCTIRFHIEVSKEESNDTRNRKILVFQPNFTTSDLDVVFILPDMAGEAGGLSLHVQGLQTSSFL
jgi:hypothetical protein